RNSVICTWTLTRETTRGTFARFALPMTWDFAEAAPLEESSGGYPGAIDWTALYVSHVLRSSTKSPAPRASQRSATEGGLQHCYDVVVTDPPYYDAINYADLMD